MAGLHSARRERLCSRDHFSERQEGVCLGADASGPPDSVFAEALDLGYASGAVSHEHLEYYLDEFTFRFNRRRSANRGKLFYRLVQQALVIDPVPYKSMIRCAAIGADGDHNL